jgi:isopropylmalate/homocitrate/citramalate synthase
LHTHNDRGTGIAATELGLMAGADRVEGTLFGNGERTGNVDIVTVALNLFSQGIDPQLDFSELKQVAEIVSVCNDLPIHPRHPYAGQLVFTAFSGSHQFAIDRGMTHRSFSSSNFWDVPYLPIDPADIGRDYEADAIRINNQSGGYGVAHVLRVNYGWRVPKALTRDFTDNVVKSVGGSDITEELGDRFQKEYMLRESPFRFVDFTTSSSSAGTSNQVKCCLTIDTVNERRQLVGVGPSPLSACQNALQSTGCIPFEIVSCHKHSTNQDADPRAMAYVQIETEGRRRRFGVGIDANTNRASAKALLNAVNRVCEIKTYVRTEFAEALETEFHCIIPDDMKSEFESAMDAVPNALSNELPASSIWNAFRSEFVEVAGPVEFVSIKIGTSQLGMDSSKSCILRVKINGIDKELVGVGKGTIDASIHALQTADLGERLGKIEVVGGGYHASTTGASSDVAGISFINIKTDGRGRKYGVGIDENTVFADVKAIISALNRILQTKPKAPETLVAVMKEEFGVRVPEGMHHEFLSLMNLQVGRKDSPYSSKWVWEQFLKEFVDRKSPYEFFRFEWQTLDAKPNTISCELTVRHSGVELSRKGTGVGILDAAKNSLVGIAAQNQSACPDFRLLDFVEHSTGSGTEADAIAFVSIDLDHHGIKYGAGIDSDVTTARVKALLSAVNRSFRKHEYCEFEFLEAMKVEFGCELPDEMYAEFTDVMKSIVPETGDAVQTQLIWERFAEEYLKKTSPYRVERSTTLSDSTESEIDVCDIVLDVAGKRFEGTGRGSNTIAACKDALSKFGCPDFEVLYFGEHFRHGISAESVAFVQIDISNKVRVFGVGLGPNSDQASVKALVSALNRA